MGHPVTHPRRAPVLIAMTMTGAIRATREVGPAARPWAACLRGGMMRVYLRTVLWVWLATPAAGTLTWQATTERAEDWASLWVSISAGQGGYVPQLSPSGEMAE